MECPDSPSVSDVACGPHLDPSTGQLATVGFPDSHSVSEGAYGPRLEPIDISKNASANIHEFLFDCSEQLQPSSLGGHKNAPPLTKLQVISVGTRGQHDVPVVGISLQDASLGFFLDKEVASIRVLSRRSMPVAHEFIEPTLAPRESDPQSYVHLSQLVCTYLNKLACPSHIGPLPLALSTAPEVCQQSSTSAACMHARIQLPIHRKTINMMTSC